MEVLDSRIRRYTAMPIGTKLKRKSLTGFSPVVTPDTGSSPLRSSRNNDVIIPRTTKVGNDFLSSKIAARSTRYGSAGTLKGLTRSGSTQNGLKTNIKKRPTYPRKVSQRSDALSYSPMHRRKWDSLSPKPPKPSRSPMTPEPQVNLESSYSGLVETPEYGTKVPVRHEDPLTLHRRKTLPELLPRNELKITKLYTQINMEDATSMKSHPPISSKFSNPIDPVSKTKNLPHIETSPISRESFMNSITSPPSWSQYLPEDDIDQVNQKIVIIEKELNRLYKKKRILLDAQAQKDEEVHLPIEQRLRRLYSLLPNSSQKVWKQTSVTSRKRVSEQKVPLLQELHVKYVKGLQNIIRMMIQRNKFLEAFKAHKQRIESLRQTFYNVDQMIEKLDENESEASKINTIDYSNNFNSTNNINGNITLSDTSLSIDTEAKNKVLNAVEDSVSLRKRDRLILEERSAIIIQRLYKRYNLRRFILMSCSARKIQRWWSYRKKLNAHVQQVSQIEAALKIQQVYKRYKFRQFLDHSYKARRIQRVWARYKRFKASI